MPHFLGIDGGGTRTTAWLADEAGRVLGRGLAGPSNPLKVGFKAAERELLRAARQAVAAGLSRHRTGSAASARQRGRPKPPLHAVVVGLAGTDRPPVHNRLARWLKRAIPARHHLLTSDAHIALRAAVGNSPGIIVVSGTGSIAYGRDARGRVLRSGGWGTLFDDAGSGYDLGRKAIAAALRDLDGRGPRSQLTKKICDALELADITQIILRPLTPQQIAGLFPLVLEAARRQDFVAQQLCDEAGRDLADLAVALLRRMGEERHVVPVVSAGGVFRAGVRILRSFKTHLRKHAPSARVLLLRHPPVEGALALAREISELPRA